MVYNVEEAYLQKIDIRSGKEKNDTPDYRYLIFAMKKLKDKDFQVLELRFFEDKSFAEIAYILNQTESTAKMRTYRALDRLKSIMERRDQDDKILILSYERKQFSESRIKQHMNYDSLMARHKQKRRKRGKNVWLMIIMLSLLLGLVIVLMKFSVIL